MLSFETSDFVLLLRVISVCLMLLELGKKEDILMIPKLATY